MTFGGGVVWERDQVEVNKLKCGRVKGRKCDRDNGRVSIVDFGSAFLPEWSPSTHGGGGVVRPHLPAEGPPGSHDITDKAQNGLLSVLADVMGKRASSLNAHQIDRHTIKLQPVLYIFHFFTKEKK